MNNIVGCTKDGLMDMLWCDKCKHEAESIECIKLRHKLNNGYVVD